MVRNIVYECKKCGFVCPNLKFFPNGHVDGHPLDEPQKICKEKLKKRVE